MKISFLILFFFISLLSSLAWGETWDDLVQREGIYYKKFTDVPFIGSVEGVYKNLDRIPKLSMRGSSTLTNTLVENRESAFLSRTLATIQCSVDDNEETFSTVSLNMLNLKEIDRSAFALFLDDYRFCNSEKHKLIEMVSDLSTQVV